MLFLPLKCFEAGEKMGEHVPAVITTIVAGVVTHEITKANDEKRKKLD